MFVHLTHYTHTAKNDAEDTHAQEKEGEIHAAHTELVSRSRRQSAPGLQFPVQDQVVVID